jgi:hypothetical protein
MAGERNVVEAVVRARYEAAGTMESFVRDLDRLGREANHAGKGIRELAAPLAFELAPALGTTGGQISRLVGSVALLGTGFGALAAAATGLAGIIAGRLVEAWQKARVEQENWQRAFSGGDIGRMTSAIQTQVDVIRNLGDQYKRVVEFQSRIDPRIESQLRGPGSPGAQARRAQAGIEAGLGRIDEGNLARGLVQQSIDLDRAETQGMADAKTYIRDETRRREAAMLKAIQDAFERTGKLFSRDLSEEFLGLEQIGDPTLTLAGRAAVSQGREASIRAAIARNIEESKGDEFGGGAEQIGLGPTLDETKKGAADLLHIRMLSLDIDRELAELAASRINLTREQKDVMAQQVIEATRLRDIESAGEDPRLKELANARAAMAQINLELSRLQRDNPLAGLAKGFSDVADAASSAGETMRDFAQQTAFTMQRSFSDLFFNVITGNFRNLADVGKQFGLAMARNFTDALATSATAPILRGLAGLTGGFFPASGVGLLNLAPEGTQLVSSLSRAGFNVGGTAGGVGAGTGLYGGLYSAPSSVGTETGFVGHQAALSAQPLGGLGAGLGGVDYTGLGIGVAGVGLGIAASQYSGMTAGAFGAASIGLTAGAGIATLLGASSAASFGIGAAAAVVAMVAYVAIAGATSARNERPNTGWRAIELAAVLDRDGARIRSASSFLELAEAIRQAMHQAFGGPRTGYTARQTAGQRVPEGRGGSMATAGYAVSIAGREVILPGGTYPPTMSLEDFAALLSTDSESFRAALQLGTNSSALRQINSNFEQAVKDQAKVIAAINAVPVAYLDVAPGLQRFTVTTAGSISDAEISGRQIMVDRGSATRAGLSDAAMDLLTRRLADRNTQTNRLPDFPRELQFVI